MATWPVNPTWTDPATINNGNEYDFADGITAEDIDAIIEDLLYLYSHESPSYETWQGGSY